MYNLISNISMEMNLDIKFQNPSSDIMEMNLDIKFQIPRSNLYQDIIWKPHNIKSRSKTFVVVKIETCSTIAIEYLYQISRSHFEFASKETHNQINLKLCFSTTFERRL